MRPFTSILILLLTGLSSQGQKTPEIKSMITSADTIFLVSHEQTDGIIIVNEKTGKKSEPKKVVFNGRPNRKVITQSVILPDTARQTLLKIMTKQSTDKTVESCNSFVPFHSLLLIKDGKTSLIDISFGCNTFVMVTKKLSTTPIYFGKDNMRQLELFFKNNGISVD
jgi:hypothetical protein